MEDESGLIQALQQNSQEAVEQLVALHGDRLLRSAYLICGNETDAQDIVSTTRQPLDLGHVGGSDGYDWLCAQCEAFGQ